MPDQRLRANTAVFFWGCQLDKHESRSIVRTGIDFIISVEGFS